MNAYVFVHEATSDVLDGLRGLVDDPGNDIRAVATLTGRFDAVIALSADDLSALESAVMNDIRGTGVTKTETAVELPVARIPDLRSPRWNPPLAVEAWMRIRVAPGRAADVLDSLAGTGLVAAATAVAGEFDVLALVGGDTFEDVAAAVVEVSNVDGIAWSATAFATNVQIYSD